MNAIFSCYFTGKPDPQRKAFVQNNDIGYMEVWADSVRGLGLDAFVFHDNLSHEFVAEHTQDGLTFVRVDNAYPHTTNDHRFLTYLDFVERHAFDHVVMTDISDVKAVCNPFPLMEQDKLYLGADRRLVQHLSSGKLSSSERYCTFL